MAATALARHHAEEELKRELELVQPQNHTEAVTIVKDGIHKPCPATLIHAINVSINFHNFLINRFNVLKNLYSKCFHLNFNIFIACSDE